jgi:sugar phosphate isomerase/epimerase
MKLGLKLEIGFATNHVYRELYGDRDILSYLLTLGVEAIETPIGPETDSQALSEHLRRCCPVGFQVSLHPYTEKTTSNPAFFSPVEDNLCLQQHRRFFQLAAEAANLQKAPTVVNIHPAAAPEPPSRRELLEQSVRFFSWAREWCRLNAPSVRVVAELQIAPNPDESVRRIGDNYAELLEIVERSGCQACWDFGHAIMNHRRFNTPRNPPIQLLEKIGHVHCHDVDSQDDHRPLVFNNVPWSEFLTSIVKNGFDGIVLLEVPPLRFLAAGGLNTLVQSVQALSNFIENARPKSAPSPL